MIDKLNSKPKPSSKKGYIFLSQLFLFISAIVLLSVLNLYINSIEIKRPVILLAGCVFTMFNFKNSYSYFIITKIILLYIIETLFNQLSNTFIHITAFSAHLPLVIIIPLFASFMLSRFKPNQLPADKIQNSTLFKSWAIAIIIIILHMLFLQVLLENIYGYGYGHNFAVLANMCMYFLIFVFCWQQLDHICIRRSASVSFCIFFIIIIIRGF